MTSDSAQSPFDEPERYPEPVRTAEYGHPDHFVLHLSDTHLLPRHGRLYGRVDPSLTVRRILAELDASGTRPEALIFTGDLADHGDAAAYRTLRAIVEPVANRMGAQVIWCMGNHDRREVFREELFGQVGTDRPVDRVDDVNGLRVITLDTTVPGQHWGAVTGDQLDWLAEELSVNAPHGTLLAMHHPPLPTIQDLATLVELREQTALAEVLEGSDVRQILAGHLHFSTAGTFAGIPVSVASATCYTQDLTAAPRSTRPQDAAQSYNLVHVWGEVVLNSVVPVTGAPALSWTSPERSAEILAEHRVLVPAAGATPGPSRPDAVDHELQAMTSPIRLPRLPD